MSKPALDLFCPSYDMLYGDNKLEFIQELGTSAKASDRYIIQGGYVEHGYGCYWTKTDDGYNSAHSVYPTIPGTWRNVNNRVLGCRPASTFSSIKKIYTSGVSIERDWDGVLKFYLGHDWSRALSPLVQHGLEKLRQEGSLALSHKTFTSDACNIAKYSACFVPRNEEVYEYEGKFYVRTIARFREDTAVLSNGVRYSRGDVVWCEVVPLSWLYDEKTDICMMEKIPFAGVQSNCKKNYKTENFNNTDIKMYLDTYYAPEIMQFTDVPEKKVDSDVLSKLSTFGMKKVRVNELEASDCILFDEDIFCVWKILEDRVIFSNSAGEPIVFSMDTKRQFTKIVIK